MITFDEIRIQFATDRLGGPVKITGEIRTKDPSLAEKLLRDGHVDRGIVADIVKRDVTRDIVNFSPLSEDPLGQMGVVYRGEARLYVETDPPSWVVQDASGKKFRLTLEALRDETPKEG